MTYEILSSKGIGFPQELQLNKMREDYQAVGIMRQEKYNFYANKIVENRNDLTEIWRIVKTILPNKNDLGNDINNLEFDGGRLIDYRSN